MEWYLKALKNYAGFSGRASRKEYWMFFLFHALFIVAMAFSSSFVQETIGLRIGAVFLAIYLLGTMIPSLAVTVRRLHDINRSGWSILLRFIPLVGSIILLIYLVTEGDTRDNQYGPDPQLDASMYDRIDEIGD
ncbi:MAG: DUF805 domain-containing protein [Bacteroidia bacterium]